MLNLTVPQQNIWNLQRFYEETCISNVCGAFFFKEKCDYDRLNAAINKVLLLQAGLRLRITEVDGQPMQYESAFQMEQFPCMDFLDMPSFEAFANQFAKKRFDTYNVPLFRFVIVEVAECSGVLLCASHLIVDAWAVSLIGNIIYSSYYNEDTSLNETPYSYAYFVEKEKLYLSSARFENDKVYWNNKYQSQPVECTIKPQSADARKPSAERFTLHTSTALSSEIKQFSLRTGITEAVIFETALLVYLNRINTEKDRVTIGMLVNNRVDAKEKAIVGDFVTTTPMTYDVTNVSTVTELFNVVQKEHFELFRHQKYPYAQLLRDLHERYAFSGNLYSVLFSFQNAQTGVNASTKWFSNGNCEVPLEFHVDNRDNKETYTITLDYQTEIFPQEEEIVLLAQRILYVLEQLITDPSVDFRKIKLLPENEIRRLVYDFNKTERSYPKDKCVHELFASKVKEHPDKIALIFEDQKFTYRQLDDMSDSLAFYLRGKGIGRGSIVPIASKRSWHFIVAMLGILKAGAAYMHIDISYPKERVQYMLSSANSNLCVTFGYEPADGIENISLESFDFGANHDPVKNQNQPDDLCYVIFTSGSTGKPKGLMIAHRNAVNFASYNDLNVYGKIIDDASQTILAVSSTSFDMSVTETLLPLIDGIPICLADDEQVLSQSKISGLIRKNNVRIIETTPTKMRLYISDPNDLEYLQGIKAIILGGESLPLDLYNELRKITPARIYNNYGPAETTVWSSIKEMTDSSITVGKPIANTQIYILDHENNLLPIGVPGELCISGDGVGLGYLNSPELTSEKYIPDPFLCDHKMYRTGDFAMWRADGEIIHLGRIDTQVKIRGLRIELGEIESILTQFPGVISAVVSDQKDEKGRQYLVGYYTSSEQLDEKAMRQYLSEKLPQYMVPNYFMRLDTIPMTSSGKTNRRALPQPEIKYTIQTYLPPETQEEKILCSILSQLLSNEKIGIMDDFFDLGGDSLCAIQYVSHAHSHGIEFTLQNVYDYPTVRSLCQYLKGDKSSRVVYNANEIKKFDSLLCKNVVDCSFVPEFKSLGNVLLTGATGFLGSHILDQLIKLDTGTIYCLVRNGSRQLEEVLNYYFENKYTSLIGSRIIVIQGDLTDEDLPWILPSDVKTVIHTAASVKHFGSYQYFYEINTLGTKRIVEYARRIDAKLLHISTISVSGNSLVDSYDNLRVDHEMNFTESNLYIGQPLENVYVHSKFEAELSVLEAVSEGLDAKIVRVGNLTNRTSDFRFQPNYDTNAYLKRIKAILELGYLPDYVIPLYAEFSPVDQTAEGIVKIGQYARQQTVFHLNSNKPLHLQQMILFLKEMGIHIKAVSEEQFDNVLRNAAANEATEYLYEALQNDLDSDGRLNYDNKIHVSNAFTVWFMKCLGFEWREIDREYLSGYIDYFRNIGYFMIPDSN